MKTLRIYKTRDMFLATLVVVTILAIVSSLVLSSEGQARSKLQDRLEVRAEGGATFVAVYMEEMLEREGRLAERYLVGEVTPKRMRLITDSFESAAAVLLDSDGALLASVPHNPELIGTPVAANYPHLAAAVAGRRAISPVVLSAVEQIPVVGAATPFQTKDGRRVFSAALSISRTPLAGYLETMLPFTGASAQLVDSTGQEVIGSSPGSIASTRSEPGPSAARSGVRTIDGEEVLFVSKQVAGTPWTLVSAVPTRALYAPFEAARWGAWMIVALLALFGVVGLALFGRYTAARHDYKHRAGHCPLTGLVNRDLLTEHASRELAKLSRASGSLGLLYIDIDDFKSVNDTLGHDAGNELLIQVASRLQGSLRGYDVAARIGGDEFVVLLPQVSADKIEEVTSRILIALGQPYELLGTLTTIGTSIGVAVTETERDLDQLLTMADKAMYDAKTSGKGRYQVAESSGAVLRLEH